VIKPEAIARMQESAVLQNITTLRNRVNELGVAEPIIQKAGAIASSCNYLGCKIPLKQKTF
jgi:preprotein translocase subunit SecD